MPIQSTRFRDALILLGVLLAGMWVLSFSLYSMKWDIMDITLPWNYYLTECLHNGELPLWNPFINSGFAQMGHPDTWYPITWLIGLIGGMDMGSIHFDYLLHLYLAGLGMYNLLRYFKHSSTVALLLATAYMFSGFTIGNAQHLGWVIGAAWLPWIFYYTQQLWTSSSRLVPLKLGLVAFLAFSGGYPGIFIVTAYTMTFFWLWQLWRGIDRKALLLRTLATLLVFLSLSAVVITGLLDLAPHINRGQALALSAEGWGVLSGSLSTPALWTFLFPFASTANADFWQADLTLVNCYLGLIPLLLLLYGNWSVRKSLFRHPLAKYTGLGLLFLGIALGDSLPLRAWLYHLPLLDLFRFPTLFRLFAIFFLLIAIAPAFSLLQNKEWNLRKLRFFVLLWLFAWLGIVGFSFFKSETSLLSLLYREGFLSFNQQAGLIEKVFLQSLLQTIILGISWWIFYTPTRSVLVKRLAILGIIELLFAVQLNLFGTIVTQTDPKIVDQAIAELPQGFPIPSLDIPQVEITEGAFRTLPYLNYNLNCFHKIPSPNGNSPYSFRNMRRAEENGHTALLEQPLFFIASSLQDSLIDCKTGSCSVKGIQIQDFSPNQCTLTVSGKKGDFLVFLQNHYPHWRVKINGQSVPVEKIQDTFMAVKLTEEINEVEWRFEFPFLKNMYYWSLTSFLILVLLLLFSLLRRPHYRLVKVVLLVVCLGFAIFKILQNRTIADEEIYTQMLTQVQQSQLEDPSINFIFNVDNFRPFKHIAGQNHRIQRKADLPVWMVKLAAQPGKSLAYLAFNTLQNYPETEQIIRRYFPQKGKRVTFPNGGFLQFYTQTTDTPDRQILSFQNFEQATEGWSTATALDSTVFSLPGKYSYPLNATQEYSPSFLTSFGDWANHPNLRLNVWTDFKKEGKKEALIVIQIKRGEKQMAWWAQDLSPYQNREDAWSRALFTQPLGEVKATDTLQVYLWNPGKKKVWVDNILIEIASEENPR